MFSKPPLDTVNYNYVDCLEKFFQLIYISAKERGEHRLLMEDNNQMPETEESIRLNLEIQDNPNMKLPEGYKKVMETNVDYVHVLPKRVIPDSYRMAHELVDELIFDAFGFHVIEKKPLFSSFFKVLSQPKPRVDLKEIKTRYKVMDEDQKTRGRDNFRTNTKSIEGSLNKREYTTVSNDTKQKFINKAMEDKLHKEEEAKQR